MASLFDDPQVLRQIIMDHYKYPRNKHAVEDSSYSSKHMASESCIDDITVWLKLEEGVVVDVSFDGVGCTISTASTSIMTELFKGKSKDDVLYIIEQYNNMLDEKEFNSDVLNEAIVFKNVSQQPNRVKCATIGWKAVKFILKGDDNNE